MTARDSSASLRPRRTLTALAATLALALAGGLGACSAGGESTQGSDASGSSAAGGRDAGSGADTGADTGAKASTRGLTPALQTSALTGRDVIRTADLTVLTADVDGARTRARALVADLGGVVASETTSVARRRGDAPAATPTVRLALQVPTESFDDAVGALSDLGVERELSIRQEDVTAEVADVDSRVQSARTALDRVRTLLGRANKLGAVIQLEGVIADRQADLEALQARQRALADQTELATLRLELRQPATAGRQPVDDVRGFTAGIAAGWDGLREVLVAASTAAGVVLPFALVGAVVLLPLMMWRRRRGGLVTSSTT
ncbi:hypothetical protein BH24ACT11_BH24ACT11_18590 [soil metagenome]